MRRLDLLLLTLLLVLLAGCETINDALVRQTHQEWGLSHRVRRQITEGLERRESSPSPTGPREPAPAFMDEG